MKRPELPEPARPAAPGGEPAAGVTRSTPAAKSDKPTQPAKSAKPAKAQKSAKPAKQPKVIDPAKAARADIRAARKARRASMRADRRRFTADRRRRRWLVGTVVGAIVLLFAAVFGVAYSPLMAVKTIEVSGTSSIDPTAIEVALSGQIGTPLPLVNADDIAAALGAFPAVQSFSLESVPPSTLIVRIIERTPIGSLAADGGYQLVDSAGVVMATTPEPPAGVPVLDVAGTNTDAFHAVGSMLLTLPADLRGRAVTAGASGGSDAWFQLADGPKVVWGDANDAALKLKVLQALLVTSGGASEINVAAPTAPFTR